jgi:hypothetical protein
MNNVGKIPLQRGTRRWKFDVGDLEPSEEEYELAVSGLTYFLRGVYYPEHIQKMVVVQSDNYGERTLAVYVYERKAAKKDIIGACQHWLKMSEWEGWRILIKIAWDNDVDLLVYTDHVFWNEDVIGGTECANKLIG